MLVVLVWLKCILHLLTPFLQFTHFPQANWNIARYEICHRHRWVQFYVNKVFYEWYSTLRTFHRQWFTFCHNFKHTKMIHFVLLHGNTNTHFIRWKLTCRTGWMQYKWVLLTNNDVDDCCQPKYRIHLSAGQCNDPLWHNGRLSDDFLITFSICKMGERVINFH